MYLTINTTDLYEATYYLLNGCELSGIEGSRVNGRITCRLSFRGEKIPRLQVEYFQGQALVNLFNFRRTLGQVNALVHTTKKKIKKQLHQQGASRDQGGEL